MEIGSFIELQFKKGNEYYNQNNNIIRLNTGRAAIWHAFRLSGCDAIWLPYYQCDTVRDFLKRKNVVIKYYHIDEKFDPIDIAELKNDAVLLVNYFGIMSKKRMFDLSKKYKHPIIDNSQAFFCDPIDNAFNVYSCRKFFGVPDGGYVVGKGADGHADEYEKSFSSDTSLFLLQRIEYGCEGKAYQSKKWNENRIDSEDIMMMSKLTHAILDSIDYENVKEKRKDNFLYASDLFGKLNKINPLMYFDEETTPMVYPLVVENDDLLNMLQNNKHFQGHWWSYLLEEMPNNSFEYWISRYVIPITIDQRYGKTELDYIKKVVVEASDKK